VGESRFSFGVWMQTTDIVGRAVWTCGYCGDAVAGNQGVGATPNGGHGNPTEGVIRPCPSCNGPTVFDRDGRRMPMPPPGRFVPHVPDQLTSLYEEARRSAGAGAPMAAVLACRKMLMNIAVAEGAKEGLSFIKYVEYLADNGFVPPRGKVWVDYIRKRGNEATHEIALMGEADAIALITFVEMLLRFIYEFPNTVPQAAQASGT
jgi:hypothetical protein